jgi:hypothetical protein
MKPTQDTLESIYRNFVRMAKWHHKDKARQKPFSTFWFSHDQARSDFLYAAREIGSAMGRVYTYPARRRKEAA